MTKINLRPNANTPPLDERDIPLPSTERTPAPFLFRARSSSTSENDFTFRTPSISVSPIPDPRQGEYTLSTVPRARDHTSSQLCDAVAQLGVNGNGGLSDLRDLSSALNADLLAQTPRAVRPSLPVPLDEGDWSRGSRRRRSSSNIKRHDVSDEEPPRDVFNSPEFQSAMLGTKALVRELAEALSSSPLHQEEDSKMHELHKTAVALADFKPTATRVVGFVGGAGAGKSSVINSLLDEGDLVKSGSAGGACTCAATEFHYHDSDTITIEVQLFDEDALLEQQMQLLRSYRQFHLGNLSGEDDRASFGELAMLAQDTFSSLFRSQLPSQNTLLNEDEGQVERIFKRLITELRPSSLHTVMTGLTKEACSEKLIELTSTPVSSAGESATRAAVWPYIEKIMVFLNAQILKKGLILVDLPGLRDINSARRKITELYIRNCNEIFAVCPASRATDDKTVEEIFRMAEHLENISIICTNSEAINGKECQKDWPGERAATIKKQLKIIEKHAKTIEQLEEDLGEELEIFSEEENRFYEDNLRINKLRESILKTKKTEESCKFELQSFLIKCRNGDLVESLRRKYRTGPASADTNVFCVSNTLYQEKRQAKIEIAMPYLKLSGIIDLRRHCVSIVSANQHREASAFMKTDVPKLLAAIDLWVQSGVDNWDGEMRAAVRSALDDVESRLESTLNRRAPCQQISKALCQSFKAEVYDKRRVSEWTEAAYSAACQWSAWHHSTYSAFCRQYGNYSTPAAGHHDWNGEANRQMTQDMQTPWQTFVSFVQAEETIIAEFLTSSTDSVLDSLDNHHPLSGLATMTPLRHALDLEQGLLLDAIENAYERANIQLRQLRTDAFSSLRTSYTGVAMESSYAACNSECGTGSHSRRKAIITGAFGNEALFDDIMKKLRTDVKELAMTAQNDVTATVKSYLFEIGKTMNLLRDENTADESQRDVAFFDRVSDALKASQETLRDISRNIEA